MYPLRPIGFYFHIKESKQNIKRNKRTPLTVPRFWLTRIYFLNRFLRHEHCLSIFDCGMNING